MLVTAVEPDDGVVLEPVAVLVLSAMAMPENSAALSARVAVLGLVTVMVLPVTKALMLRADRMTKRLL